MIGQYCFIKLNIKLNFSDDTTTEPPPPQVFRAQHSPYDVLSFDVGFNNAFCVPSSCSPEKVVDHLYHLFLGATTMYVPVSADCQTLQGPNDLDSIDIATL